MSARSATLVRMNDAIPPEAAAAKAEWDSKKSVARAAELNLLDKVADSIPQTVDDMAKSQAKTQIEVTRGLGKVGVDTLRADLRRLAAVLADEVRSAVGEANWPASSTSSSVEIQVRSAVRSLFSAARLASIGQRMVAAGYEDVTAQRHFVTDQDFVDEIRVVAVSLVAAERARRQLRTAIDAANNNLVEDLWAD